MTNRYLLHTLALCVAPAAPWAWHDGSPGYWHVSGAIWQARVGSRTGSHIAQVLHGEAKRVEEYLFDYLPPYQIARAGDRLRRKLERYVAAHPDPSPRYSIAGRVEGARQALAVLWPT